MSPSAKLAFQQFEDGQYALAERTALQCPPSDPDRCAALGMVYLHTQREGEALVCLTQALGSELARRVAERLGEHLAARRAMAAKLKTKDAEGEAMAAKFVSLGYALPDAGVKLSACLIVRNESRVIENCLASLKGIADEIVVVDTGSTDDTKALAKKAGAKVFDFEWCDDFSAARNASLSHATGDWALWIDADEELTHKSKTAIREALVRPQFGGYFVSIVNYLADTGSAEQYVHRPIRLFRLTPEIAFTGRIHEQVSPSIQATGRPCANLEGVELLHHGYRPEAMREKNKLERTITMLRREVEDRPDDSFQWFNLANVLSVAGKYDEAEAAALSASKSFPPKASFVAPVFHILAVSRIEQGRPEEALAACDEVDQLGQTNVVNQFNRAHALLRCGRLDDALGAIQTCEAMAWNPDIPGDYGVVTHKRSVLRGQILSQLGRFDEANAAFDSALAVDPSFEVTQFSKAANLEKLGRYAEAREMFDRALGSERLDLPARKGAMRMRIELGEHAEAARIGEETWVRYLDEDAWLLWHAAAERLDSPASLARCFEAYAQTQDPPPQMWVNWGRALEALGLLERAFECYSEAMRRAPQDANGFFNAADLLYRMGLYHDAASLYQSGLGSDGSSAQAWFCLGNCLAQLELAEGAQIAYRKALELHPGHVEATHNLAVVQGAPAIAA